MVDLDHVHGACRRRQGHAESEQESTAHELALLVGETLDDGTNDDERGANQHADSTTESINGGTDKGKRDDTANLVHGGDDAGPDAIVFDLVLCLEPGVLEEVVDEGAIVAVHGAAEEGNEGEEVDEDLRLGEGTRRLLHHGLGKGLVSADDLCSEFAL